MSKPSLRAKTAKIELDHPTEGKCGWVLELYGFDSKQVRNKIKDIAANVAEKEDDTAIRVKLDRDEFNNAEIAASAIAGWNEAFANADESIGPYTPEKASEICNDVEISWVREQVETCLRKRANFFRQDPT